MDPLSHQVEKVVKKRSLYTVLTRMLAALKSKDNWGFFLEPVNVFEVPDYLTVIKKPMDFLTMENKLNRRDYKNLEDFVVSWTLLLSMMKTSDRELTGKLIHLIQIQ